MNHPRLSKTGIEYADYAWNFASGCGNNIDGKCKAGGFKCWAYSISQRFEDHYPNGFQPTIYPEALLSPLYLKKPSRILCAFMGDLFWECPEFDAEQIVTPNLPKPIPSVCFTLHGTLRQVLFGVIRACPQHTFIFLTKQPQNLIKWSPFPDNCWVGVSCTKQTQFTTSGTAMFWLGEIKAKMKFLSFEPLLERISAEGSLTLLGEKLVDWVIIGSQTKPYKPPKIEWIEEIVGACDKAGIPVFLKNNLNPLFTKLYPNRIEPKYFTGKDLELRQELPSK